MLRHTAPLIKLGVAFVGFWAALLIVFPCLMLAREYTAAVAVPLWVLSCFWYMELMVKALGWPSWLTGVYNLWAWVRGGCGIPGIRKQEPREEITIIGDPPEATAMTATLPMSERHPNAKFKPAADAINMKVVHVGACLGPEAPLSKTSGLPLGPFEEGIIAPKTARQLRKWITRAGKKDEAYLKKQGRMGIGRISTVSSLGTKVVWLDPPPNTLPIDYFRTGDDNCGFYELLLCEDEDTGPDENKFEDGLAIHAGGSLLEKAVYFFMYFAPQVAVFLFGWLLFFSYYGMLYFFEYSLSTYSISLASGGTSYSMPGRLYNARPGDKLMLHIHCKGFTRNSLDKELSKEDGRPPVIIESMEALGMAAAMRRLQDRIAEHGVCCVYDRVGYGFSTVVETYDEVRTNRTPAAIASELHYALTLGKDPVYKKGVFWSKSVQGWDKSSTMTEVPVRSPFILVGISAGALYARQFAHDFPEDVAGLVLVDALPAINNEDGDVKTAIHKALSPFTLLLCHRYLQPMGMMNNLFANTIYGLFSARTKQNMKLIINGSVVDDSFQVMAFFMFKRAWCPTVAAEYNGLFNSPGSGIETVAAADKAGYDVPTVPWVNEENSLAKKSSTMPQYKYSSPSAAAVTARRAGIESILPLFAARTTGYPTRAVTAGKNEGLMSWLEVQNSLLGSFPQLRINPHSGKQEVMRGDVDACQITGCSEYAAMENPLEILDAQLDLWNMLGFSDSYPSNRWYLELGGDVSAFDADTFKRDLSTLVSHVRPANILVVDGPMQGSVPIFYSNQDKDATRRRVWLGGREDEMSVRSSMDANVAGASAGTRNWYSRGSNYAPIKNDGSFYVGIVMQGHKPRSSKWAQQILRGMEDTTLDPTGSARRDVFMHKYRVLSVRELECVKATPVDIQAAAAAGGILPSSSRRLLDAANHSNASNASARQGFESGDKLVCTETMVDIFTSIYVTPIYLCPQNTYRRLFGCRPCDLTATSPAGSLAADACRACGPSQHLTCTGDACQSCPPGHVSNPGSLILDDCKPFGAFVFQLKGPIGIGSTSQAVQAHRTNSAAHQAFDREAFLHAISTLVGSRLADISARGPTPSAQYPESRAREMRGATVFEVELTFAVNGTDGSDRITNVLLGNDAPAVAEARKAARRELFAAFQLLSITSVIETGRSVGACPTFIAESKVRLQAEIFAPSFFSPSHACPVGFYSDKTACVPCPDASTSDAAASSQSQCAGFVTVILAMKDPSVSFAARTSSSFGAALDAQPNGYDIMNYTGMRQSAALYSKVRGYALQPLEPIDERSPELGPQSNLCREGSNCFNLTAFRFDLSAALHGHAQPNEIRLLPPQDCSTPENAASDFCGLWPRCPLRASGFSVYTHTHTYKHIYIYIYIYIYICM